MLIRTHVVACQLKTFTEHFYIENRFMVDQIHTSFGLVKDCLIAYERKLVDISTINVLSYVIKQRRLYKQNRLKNFQR